MSYLETPDGVRLRVCERGRGNRSTILVHGWKQSHRLWDLTIARLAESERVIAFDLRGMGESDKPNSRYDFDELAADLAFVLDAHDVTDATLVGWSMGCSVSLQLLASGSPRVGRLVLVNGPIRLTVAPDFPFAMTQDVLDGYLAGVARHWPLRERSFLADSLREAHPEHVDWLVRVALQTPLDVALAVVRAQAELDHRPVVESLAVPVLASYGRFDPYYPPALADWIAEHAPRGERTIFEQSAHCIPFEEPDLFCSVISDFASRTS